MKLILTSILPRADDVVVIGWLPEMCRATFSGSSAMVCSSVALTAQSITHRTRRRLVVRVWRWSRTSWLKAAPSIRITSFDHKGSGSCRSAAARTVLWPATSLGGALPGRS